MIPEVSDITISNGSTLPHAEVDCKSKLKRHPDKKNEYIWVLIRKVIHLISIELCIQICQKRPLNKLALSWFHMYKSFDTIAHQKSYAQALKANVSVSRSTATVVKNYTPTELTKNFGSEKYFSLFGSE